jgi:hypothetical protein
LTIVVAVTLCLALTIVGLRFARHAGATEHYRFASPDRRFEIVVYRISMGFAMPGHGSDAPGHFQLRETRTGRVLHEQDVEMVQLVERIDWSPTNVSVRMLADWPLPK